MLDTMAGICGYTETQCIWIKSRYNEIQSWLNSMKPVASVAYPPLTKEDFFLRQA